MIKILILLPMLLLSGCSLKRVNVNSCSSDTLTKERKTPHTDKVAQLMSIINQCPDRVWPNLILHKRPYIVNEKEDDYIIVSHLPHCTKPVYKSPDSKLLKELKEKFIHDFTPISLDGKTSVAIRAIPLSLSKGKSRSKSDFKLLIHEAFHFLDQDSWTSSFREGFLQRFNLSEKDCTPRKYRALVRYYLKEALKNSSQNRQKALQKAAYWNKKYRKEFPQEIFVTDALDAEEGTAKFVEIRAWALTQVGCSADKKTLQDTFFKVYESEEKRIGTFGLNTEVYVIGALASALLEESSQNNWQKKIQREGVSPTQILLGSLPPIKDSHVPVEIKKKCQDFEKTLNHRKREQQNFQDILNSKDYIALSFPFIQSGYSHLISLKGVIKGYEQALSHGVSSKSLEIKFRGYHILSPEQGKNLCGENQKVIFVPKKKIFTDGSTFKINYKGKMKLNSKTAIFENINGQLKKTVYKDFMPFFLKGRGTIDKKIKQPGADLWCIHLKPVK